MIDRRPGLIAALHRHGDVRAGGALRASARAALLSVRGGGHNIAGLAVCEGGLMIDLSLMRGVRSTPGAARRARKAAARWPTSTARRSCTAWPRCSGFVSATGIGGPHRRRRLRLPDAALRLDLRQPGVDGGGDRRRQGLARAATDENADLFWALRGGSGNFGIVTSFEYKLLPGRARNPGRRDRLARRRRRPGARLLSRASPRRPPRETTCVVVMRIAPPAPWLPNEIHGKPIVAVFVCHSGQHRRRREDPRRRCARLGQPVADIVTRRPYTQMQSLLDATQPKGRRYYWKSNYLAQDRSPEGIDAGESSMPRASRRRTRRFVLFQLQGALGELPADHSPGRQPRHRLSC